MTSAGGPRSSGASTRARITLDFIVENNSAQSVRHPYIDHFCNQLWISTLFTLAMENSGVRQLLNHRSLKKEITELYGALVLMEKYARRHFNILASDTLLTFECLYRIEAQGQLYLFDLCCGMYSSSFHLQFISLNIL